MQNIARQRFTKQDHVNKDSNKPGNETTDLRQPVTAVEGANNLRGCFCKIT